MESIFTHIGPFGKFQKLSTLVVGIISCLSSMTVYSTVFLLAEPKLICLDKINNQSISNTSNACDLWESKNKTTIECVLEPNVFGSTIVTDWGLVCNKSFYASLIQTFYLIGTLLSFTMGFMADKYGRKKTCVFACFIITINYFINDVIDLKYFNINSSTLYVIYSISQAINGAMNLSVFSISFILLFEITSVKYHTLVSNINLYSYVVGELLVCLVSYLSKDWNILNWSIGGFSFLVLILVTIFLPESPSFYIANKNYEKAFEIIEKISNTNGISKEDAITYEEFEFTTKTLEKNQTVNDNGKISVISYTFHSRFNAYKVAALSIIYFALALTYFGVSLGITSIGDMNPYIIYILSCVSEVIGYMACHLNDKFRRKYVFILFLGIACVTCLLVAVIPDKEKNSVVISVFALIGKAMASGAFNISYSYTSAMFPAVVRNTMSLLVSSFGRTGSILSPSINLLGKTVWQPLPYLIFSSFSLVGCIIIASLPEPKDFN